MIDVIIKIRKYMKKLGRGDQKYNIEQAFYLIRNQIKQDECLIEEEMEDIDDDIRTRLEENWPFKRMIY